MVLSIIDSISKVAKDFQGWIIENGNNPVLWVGLFFLGLLIFYITYNALHKD